jgi:cytochrome P450
MFEGAFSNTPHVPRVQAFLDSRDMVRNPAAVFERYRARLGHTFSFHFGGVRRSIVSSDPDFIQHVLRGNRDNYPKSDIQVERMVEFQGSGLVNSDGAPWQRQRRMLARGFTPNRLAELLPMQQEVLDDLLVGFTEDARHGAVDVRHQMVRFTLRLVGKSLFGRSMSEAELDQIGKAISIVQGFIVEQIVQPYKIPWFRFSGRSAALQRVRREADAIVLRHIEDRHAKATGEKDFLRLLLETPYDDTGEPMGKDQVLIESLQFMVAGNETSSIGLTWTLYLLGRHPETIHKIREEIGRVIGDDPLDFGNLHALELTAQVIYEALRLYPPFWMIDRTAIADDEVGAVKVPAGTLVIPYIYGTHRNTAIWEDPETFDPTRFAPDQRKARHPFGYIPFGGGPRMCIGNNMAIMQILLIVVALVRRYDFAMASEEPVPIRAMMLLRPSGPVNMIFKARSDSPAS